MTAGPRVLVADANPAMRRILEALLVRDGMQVTAVADGTRALEALTGGRPDVVIADHALPAPDGYEIAAFRTRHPELAHVAVVLTVGAFETVDRGRAAQGACDDVFAKPFDAPRLVARVRALATRGRGTETDRYFDRLSAVLEARDRERPRPLTSADPSPEGEVPTLESILRVDDERPRPPDP